MSEPGGGRGEAKPSGPTASGTMMSLSETQIRRYSRHVLLPDVGGTGQARLLDASVALDLDGPAAIVTATYLAAAGVGTLVLSGGDRPVTPDDVASGIALGQADVGRPLVEALSDRLAAINPDVRAVRGTRCEAPGARHPVQGTDPPDRQVADALIAGGLEACRIVHELTRAATSSGRVHAAVASLAKRPR